MTHLPTALPVHHTARDPRTGELLQALWVSPSGRVFWPLLGASPDDPSNDDGASGADDSKGGGSSDQGGDQGGGGTGDDKSQDLGYPRGTPVVEMTEKQQAAYWRHQSQKHEGRYKSLTGDRSFDDVRKDLSELAEIRRAQMTPSEQAIAEAREQGKAEALALAGNEAATAIFIAQLTLQGHSEDAAKALAENFNVTNFVKDGRVDTDSLAAFAKRFDRAATADEDDKDKRRDFGGGKRSGSTGGGSIAAHMAERRAAREAKN
ncbi:hypothetical protein [Nocardioides bruguierae]|uniref:DUF4355 domain-containing protein n=1 Tax=Nocardioides bruguierae TaxID=2945102 RepID=A0A9X2DAX5_9ACTN|nr:hypothetical protein [Nocardioides bruguierae]MCM0622503.1 hypothetical protein [Nocardioides bruguierae]